VSAAPTDVSSPGSGAPGNGEVVMETKLEAGALHLPGVLMQAMTHIAPSIGVIFGIQAVASFAGIATPVAFLISGAIMLLLGVSVTQLARRLPSAGGYFTYVSRGVGPRAGFFTTWCFLLYEPVGAGINLAFAGGLVEATLKSEYGFTLPWWVTALVLGLILSSLTYAGIKLSVKTVMILGSIELVACTTLALWGLLSPGHGGVNLTPFDPSKALSFNGLFLGVVFCIFNFAGFESVAPLAEETANPRRNLPRAIMLSLSLVLVFFLFTSWGILVGWGTDHVGTFVSNGSPVLALAHRLWHGAWIIMLLVYLNAVLAACIAVQNTGTRFLYGISRAGLLPRALSKVDPKRKTPINAVYLQCGVTMVIAIAGGIVLGPEQTLIFGGLVLTLMAIAIYSLGNLAVFLLYRREFRPDFDLRWHVICPLLSTAALVWLGYKSVSPFPTGPAHAAPYVAIGWAAIGLVVTVFAARKGRDWLKRAGEVPAEIAESEREMPEHEASLGLGHAQVRI
jgi:amino acid transporter